MENPISEILATAALYYVTPMLSPPVTHRWHHHPLLGHETPAAELFLLFRRLLLFVDICRTEP
jgi:hypothetical protein